jgi:hypothetical protein
MSFVEQLGTTPSANGSLENRTYPRENGPLIAGQDWFDGLHAARFLSLRAEHGQEAHPYIGRRPIVAEPLEGAISGSDGGGCPLGCPHLFI